MMARSSPDKRSPRAKILQRMPGLLLLLGLGYSFTPPARADVIIFKDGFAIHGKVFRDKALLDNPNGAPFVVDAENGFYKCDDGARITIFSPSYRQVGDAQNTFNRFADDVVLRTKVPAGVAMPLALDAVIQKEVDFDDRWTRKVNMIDGGGRLASVLHQQILTLTPFYLRMGSNSHAWQASYLTQEWGPERILKILRLHPEIKEDPAKPEPAKRRKLILFLTQAGWYEYADKEVSAYAKDFPTEIMPLAEIRQSILTAKAETFIKELEIARDAGRFEFIKKRMPQFPKEGVLAAETLKFIKFKGEYETVMKKFDSASKHLEKLTKIQLGVNEQFLIPAGKLVLTELYPEAGTRLETFITLCDQVEREIAAGKPSSYKPEELLSLAVTGWLLGKSSAETKPTAAKKLWDARQTVRDYLSNDQNGARLAELGKLLKRTDLPPIDELAQIASLMPPPFVNKDFSTAIKKYNTGPIKGFNKGVEFYLQLPPEYQPSRRTPLLILLPDGGETPENLIKKFGDLPARYGYIVAVPVWNEGIRNSYTFTEEERGTVPAMLSHLRRFLQVDSDRVFMFGCNEAANMAYDVGLAHSDLFAGVTAMLPYPSERRFDAAKKAGAPSKIVLLNYWQNAQQLPLYLVLADRVGEDARKTFERTLRPWMMKGFPALASIYKGRSPDFFFQELPFVFDWMSRKKRSTGLPNFGGDKGLGAEGTELRSMRLDDNHFYWVTGEVLPNKTLEKNPNGQFTPARICGKVLEGNVAQIDAVGFSQVTVSVPRGMFEIGKPIKIRVGSNVWNNGNKPLTPNLQIMLEDLYDRADRQHVIIEKFEIKGTPYFQK